MVFPVSFIFATYFLTVLPVSFDMHELHIKNLLNKVDVLYVCFLTSVVSVKMPLSDCFKGSNKNDGKE